MIYFGHNNDRKSFKLILTSFIIVLFLSNTTGSLEASINWKILAKIFKKTPTVARKIILKSSLKVSDDIAMTVAKYCIREHSTTGKFGEKILKFEETSYIVKELLSDIAYDAYSKLPQEIPRDELKKLLLENIRESTIQRLKYIKKYDGEYIKIGPVNNREILIPLAYLLELYDSSETEDLHGIESARCGKRIGD
jgi:hypothetical protein